MSEHGAYKFYYKVFCSAFTYDMTMFPLNDVYVRFKYFIYVSFNLIFNDFSTQMCNEIV